MILKSCIAAMLLISNISIFAQWQKTAIPDIVNVSEIKLEQNLKNELLWFVDSSLYLRTEDLPHVIFKDIMPDFVTKRVHPALITKDVYLKFAIENTSDTNITLYFIPGFYFKTIELFSINEIKHTVKKLPAAPAGPTGYKKIIAAANQTNVIIAKLQFAKTTVNVIDPVLLKDYYLPSFIRNKQNSAKDSNIITYVFSGILLMMIFYSLAVYVLNRNIEFLFYAGYAFCLAVLFFLKSYLFKHPSSFTYLFESYLDFVIQSLATLVYLTFLMKFIDSKKKFQFLHYMFLIQQILIGVSFITFTYLHIFTNIFWMQDSVENCTKYLWSFGTVIFIIYSVHAGDKLLNYLALGHLFLLIGGVISLYLIKSPGGFGRNVPAIFDNALIYYELGLLVELIFFLAALAYKNRNDIIEKAKESERLYLMNERQDLEKQLAVFSAKQDERNRISADMHDELGSGVTAIRLMSEIVKAKMKENTLPEINRISHTANDLINKMNTIIWTMKSENDSLHSLITYVRIYAIEFFDNTSISCSINIPASFPNPEVSGEKRRNIFLSIKETLNNILKHSKSNEVCISFHVAEKLTIIITDNGVGIDPAHLRLFGSGLQNIRKRIEGIDGCYAIENINGNGTKSTFEFTL